MTGLSIAYGLSKFLMGSVSDRSNPKYFLPLGLLLSAGIIFASGTIKWIYSSLALVVALQTLNGWVQGMGWPPCGKTMVHWWSTKERGLTVATWNVAHNVGGALVANFALLGVALFNDWGAKFYFNALIAAAVAVVSSSCCATRRSRAACRRSRSTRTTTRPTTAPTTSGRSPSRRSSSSTS
jgi:MFS transporter, OPA family, glycerol-3-phosphate transporter